MDQGHSDGRGGVERSEHPRARLPSKCDIKHSMPYGESTEFIGLLKWQLCRGGKYTQYVSRIHTPEFETPHTIQSTPGYLYKNHNLPVCKQPPN